MPTVTMSVRLDEKLKRDLSAWAAANHTSVNDLMTRLAKTEVENARANLETDFEASKAELKRLTAVSMKFLDKAPGEKLTMEDFDEGELGRDYVEELMTLDEEFYRDGVDRDGVDRDCVEDELGTAKWKFEKWSTCKEKLGQEPPDQEIVNKWGYITPETRKRIFRILDYLDLNFSVLMKPLRYKNLASLWNVLNGGYEISPRVRSRLAQWIEYNEKDIPKPPNLTLVVSRPPL